MSISEGESERLQAACNSAVRAVGGVPRRGKTSVTELRRSFRLQSVREIRESFEMMEAWNRREKFLVENEDRRETRGKVSKKIAAPDQRGQRRYLTDTVARLAWNRLPGSVKSMHDQRQVKKVIKEFCSTMAGRCK